MAHRATLWLKDQSLQHKLLTLYILLFVLPFFYLLYVIWMLSQAMDAAESGLTYARLSLRIGVPAAFVMASAAFLLMQQSARRMRKVTHHAINFVRELNPEVPELDVEPDEVQRISGFVTDMISELRQKLSDVDRYASELAEANQKLTEMAVNDGLTQLYNHKHARQMLLQELRRAERFHHPLSIIMLDLDNFKAFNDTYGHLLGDKALRDVSRILRHHVRGVDIPTRYGGEEFLIILPEAGLDIAGTVAERLRAAIAAHAFETGHASSPTTHLTASLGVATIDGDTSTDLDLIGEADRRLYVAKREGKNRVQTA